MGIVVRVGMDGIVQRRGGAGIEYCGGGHITGRRRKREGFDKDGSGGIRQTDTDALEEENTDGNEVDKGRAGASDNGGRETGALRARAGSLHCPPSGIRLPFHPFFFIWRRRSGR